MGIKVLITDVTYRTEPQQWAVIEPMLVTVPSSKYLGEEGRALLTRQTTRQEQDIVYVASIACLPDDEDDLIDFLRAAKKRNRKIECVDEESPVASAALTHTNIEGV